MSIKEKIFKKKRQLAYLKAAIEREGRELNELNRQKYIQETLARTESTNAPTANKGSA